MVRDRVVRLTVALLLSVLLVPGACSPDPSGDRAGSGGDVPAAAGEEAGSDEDAAKGEGGDDGAGSDSGSDSGGGSGSGPGASPIPARSKCEPEKDCMAAYVHSEIDWGCDYPSPNEVCKIPFIGYWFLFTQAKGSVAFFAFENGAPEPAHVQEITIPPLPRKGNMGTSTRLLYKANPGTHTVTFQAVLKDGSGNIVARGTPSSFPVKSS